MEVLLPIRFSAQDQQPRKEQPKAVPLIKEPQPGAKSSNGTKLIPTVNLSTLNASLPSWARSVIMDAGSETRMEAARILSQPGDNKPALRQLVERISSEKRRKSKS